MRCWRSSTLLAVAVILGACTTRSDPSGPGTQTAIRVQDNQFSPASTSVVEGTTVRWTWEGGNPHTVTFDDGPESTVKTTGTFDRTFATAGTYPYLCAVHGAGMSGTVTVTVP